MSTKSKKGSKEENQDQSADLTPEQEIAQLKEEIEESNEKFLRAVADFDNFRKRLDRDKEHQVLEPKEKYFHYFWK